MEEIQKTLQGLVGLMGFRDFSIHYDSEKNRFLIFIEEREVGEHWLPSFVMQFDYLVRLIVKKYGHEGISLDVNNYRKERENLIIELARGAARKVAATKEVISLPAMNAYERRLIHVELASRPDLTTESVGEGKERYIVVKPIT